MTLDHNVLKGHAAVGDQREEMTRNKSAKNKQCLTLSLPQPLIKLNATPKI